MAKENKKQRGFFSPPAGTSISWSAEPASILEVGISWNGSNHGLKKKTGEVGFILPLNPPSLQ